MSVSHHPPSPEALVCPSQQQQSSNSTFHLCPLYDTVPLPLKLSTLWQPRYSSCRTASWRHTENRVSNYCLGPCICAIRRIERYIQLLKFVCILCCTAAAVLCHLYHTVPLAFNLSTSSQPLSNNTSTAILCLPLL